MIEDIKFAPNGSYLPKQVVLKLKKATLSMGHLDMRQNLFFV